jgi:hypothetical protein
MSTSGVRSDDASGIARVKDVDLKLAVVDIPVSGVDRAKVFDGSLGWRLDADFPFDNGFRVIQFTPPGSGGWFNLGGLVQFGTNITSTARLGPGPFTPSSRTSDLRAVSPEWDLSPRRARRLERGRPLAVPWLEQAGT